MYNNGYDPETLVHNYRRIAHGKARAGAIRSAINQAHYPNHPFQDKGQRTYGKLPWQYVHMQASVARAGAIRSAINQADLNKDIPYMMFFREELCDESYWFVDELEVVTVYPEFLAIMDRYSSLWCNGNPPICIACIYNISTRSLISCSFSCWDILLVCR